MLIRQDIEGDVEAKELDDVLNVLNVGMFRMLVDLLNRVLGPPHKMSNSLSTKVRVKVSPFSYHVCILRFQ